VTVECGGQIIDEPGAPDEGMLIDFGDLKTIMTEEIHDRFDHGFIVYEGDTACIAALQNLQQLEPEHTLKVITVDFIPTAENIALWVANQLRPIIEHHWRGNLWLEGVTVWETPTSVAYVSEVRREVG
jgi:6-pyruvoyltetrahydropterin/6-carboxytetrahydropterin synthase